MIRALISVIEWLGTTIGKILTFAIPDGYGGEFPFINLVIILFLLRVAWLSIQLFIIRGNADNKNNGKD